MNLDEKGLSELEYFASLLLTDDELDAWLAAPRGTVAAAVRNPDSPIGRAVRTGRLKTKCEVRESILMSARRHSTPAQQMANDLLRALDSQ